MDDKELDFSALEPKQKKVRGPDGKRYMLITASVDATIKFRNAASRGAAWRQDADGKMEVVGFNEPANCEFVLVANTLALTVADAGQEVLLNRQGNPVLISEDVLKRWNGSVIEGLYAGSIELSPWLKKGDNTAEDEETPNPKESSRDGAASSS